MPEGLSLRGVTKLGEEAERTVCCQSRPILSVKRIIRPKYRLADGRIITAPCP